MSTLRAKGRKHDAIEIDSSSDGSDAGERKSPPPAAAYRAKDGDAGASRGAPSTFQTKKVPSIAQHGIAHQGAATNTVQNGGKPFESTILNPAHTVHTLTAPIPPQSPPSRPQTKREPSATFVNPIIRPESALALPNENPIIQSQSSPVSVVSHYVSLPRIPPRVFDLPPLRPSEIRELEMALQLVKNNPEQYWKQDWLGNLQLISKEVSNPNLKKPSPEKGEMTRALWEWAVQSQTCQKLVRDLLAHVFNQRGTPDAAKDIIVHISSKLAEQDTSGGDIHEMIKRLSYDPTVLTEDNWVTWNNGKHVGASGGPVHIGQKVLWDGYLGVVIAYTHDDEIGDLWKAMWLDGFETFDLEAEELDDAKKKYERKRKKQEKKRALDEITGLKESEQPANKSARFANAVNFRVEGIQHGIVLATTYNPLARKNVPWPARVMHASELQAGTASSKRSTAKGKVKVVFFLPYWNEGANVSKQVKGRPPLFELDSVDASSEMIKEYPFSGQQSFNLSALQTQFKFTGLSSKFYATFVQSHRLAFAFYNYARKELPSVDTPSNVLARDVHPLHQQTAKFPYALLHLPFSHLLDSLPSLPDTSTDLSEADTDEPPIQLSNILKCMKPPLCFAREVNDRNPAPANGNHLRIDSVPTPSTPGRLEEGTSDVSIENFAQTKLIAELTRLQDTEVSSANLKQDLARLIGRSAKLLPSIQSLSTAGDPKAYAITRSFLLEVMRTKAYGEDVLTSDQRFLSEGEVLLKEWRKCCERLYKFVSINSGQGNGKTAVLTDHRCNLHVTKHDCVERAVRLPAALKACREAGAGASLSFPLINQIGDEYIELAEKRVIQRAHTSHYVRKIRERCAALSETEKGAELTEDSDGGGNGDTTGTRYSFEAALIGVAAALQAADLVVGGRCTNAFCVTRPPGHHAGRVVHAMDAVSNGFCLLNPAACAAIFATMPGAEGGLGLKRVCIIDFDVHHGNGTQDILCNTYDPRFFYISVHAGGAQINGYETEDSENDFRSFSSKNQDGIFPGRSGDHSPHPGVLNIPLGEKVTPHDVASALLKKIEPAVAEYCPDLVILSAGFDAHKNDPLGLGGLDSDHFGSLTEVACNLARRCCNGRVISVLEGGYGVPCCRPQKGLFLPSPTKDANTDLVDASQSSVRPGTTSIMDLDLPEEMDDQVTPGMQKKLERCHQEGFIDCVRQHVRALKNNNRRSN